MKRLRIVFLVILTLLIGLSCTRLSTVNAADGKLSVKVYNNSNKRRTGLYTVYNGNNVSGQTRAEVFKLVAKDGEGGASDSDAYSATNENRMLYCLYYGVGLGSGTNSKVYNKYFDLKKDELGTYRGLLPSDETTFDEMVWVLNNVIDPYKESEIRALFEKIEDKYNLMDGTLTGNIDYLNAQDNGNQKLIDAIEVAQQDAIWKYTNWANKTDYNPNYKVGMSSYKDANYYSGMYNPYDYVYRYLTEQAAIEVANGYTHDQNEECDVTITGVSSTEERGDYYLVGPVEITNVNKIEGGNFSIVSGDSDITNSVKIYGEDKVEKTQGGTLAKIKTTVTNNHPTTAKFYVGVRKNTVTEIEIKASVIEKVRTITYWTTASETTNQQPVAIIKEQNKELKAELKLPVTQYKNDLALRKWITHINGQAVTESREPVITIEDLRKFKNGESAFTTVDTPDTKTTARKTHTKDPLEVHPGDTVRYKIRVYNEGNTNVDQVIITDTITNAMEYNKNNQGKIIGDSGTTWAIATTDNNGNPITGDKIVVGAKRDLSLAAFPFNKSDAELQVSDLKYVDFEIECKIKADATDRNLLKNVAEVKFIHETTSNTYRFLDIDSEYENISDTIADIKNYNPASAREGKGYEDDDDYEQLYIAPPKKYDLALRKFITKVNGVNVNTSREPEITSEYKEAFKNGTGLFATSVEKDHTKDPVAVNVGDKVIYTIRIYNEGEIDGRAMEITDYLPEGLDFVPKAESTINTTYNWTVDGKKIKTTYLSGTDKKIDAFNKETLALDYEDVQIECVVNENATSFNLKNIAEITADDGDDIDSTPGNVNTVSYSPNNATKGIGEEDDDDYENLKLLPKPGFDMALRKYIVGVGETSITDRIPNIATGALGTSVENPGTDTTAEYKHRKNAVEVKAGDIVKYRISVYNEGNVDGYVFSITDYLPNYLEFVPSTLSNEYDYTFDETSRKLEINQKVDPNLDGGLRPYLFFLEKYTGSELHSGYIEFCCKVNDNYEPSQDTYLTNVATMDYGTDARLSPVDEQDDRDSKPTTFSVPSQEQLVSTNELAYYGNTANKQYLGDSNYHYRGQEDDDDFEKLLVKGIVNPKFDLALRKFITGVNNQAITDREPTITQSSLEKLATGEARFDDGQTATKTHSKTPIQVRKGYNITYTIRVYNEGDVDGKATEITDYLPEGLKLAENSTINTQYGWKADSTNPQKVTTDYLANKTIKAFSKEKNAQGQYEIFYEDVKIECTVKDDITPTTNMRNVAEITDDDNDDRDSEPKNLTEEQIKNYNPGTSEEGKGYEDDDDYEDLCVYDLALRKWVTTAIVIEDDVKKVMYTGHKAEDDPESVVKVEVNEKRIKSAVIKFVYSIRITNEGSVEGKCEEITDYIPEGLKFVKEDNPDWVQDSQNERIIRTDKLKNTTLQPGQAAEVEVALTWINDENNMGIKINTAEISKDDGEDIDSEPNNKVEGEDDIDTAPVALTVVTGSAPLYTTLIAGVLFILGAGVVVIKKVVL